MKSCAIIGHRPTRFKFKYKENNTGCKRLKKRLYDQFVLLYEQGVHSFLVGGDLGVDIWSGEILLDLKKQQEYRDIELIMVLPYPNHDERWDEKSKRRIAFLKKNSARCIIAGSNAGSEGYFKKNHYLVDHADCMVAVYDNDRSAGGGIALTVQQMEKQEKPVILIHPDTGLVSNSLHQKP